MSYDRKLAAEAEKLRAHLPTVCEVIDTLCKNNYEAQEDQLHQRERALMKWTESKLPWTPEPGASISSRDPKLSIFLGV